MWKTAFKNFEVMIGRPYHFNFLMAVFHKFHLVHSWIAWPIYRSVRDSWKHFKEWERISKKQFKFSYQQQRFHILAELVNLKCIFTTYDGIQNESPVPNFFTRCSNILSLHLKMELSMETISRFKLLFSQ